MNAQNVLYIEMTNALHKWLNNHHNDEADYQKYHQCEHFTEDNECTKGSVEE